MIGRKVSVPEPLATVITDQRFGSLFSLLCLDIDVRHLFIFVIGLGSLTKLVERCVLILFEPLEGLINCGMENGG